MTQYTSVAHGGGSAGTEAPGFDRDIQRALLDWYRQNGRDLPWRRTSEPYAILVAEIMLQQTQVDRVLPKYREFLNAFPTVFDLAAAPRSEVIRRWAPLGYNLRAVRLYEIARQSVAFHHGRFPESVEGLRSLKGIGPYTAGAVACFAFRRPVAFLDTNIRRVLGRCLLGMPFPRAGDDAAVLAAANEALPEDAYDWHQALMDLGATVCSWTKPGCTECPIAAWCGARHHFEEPPSGSPRRVAEAAPVYRTQPKFAGSRRYYRGRIVAALRTLPPGEEIPLDRLGGLVKPGFAAGDLPWLRELAEGLAGDGLARLTQSEDGEWALSLPE